MNTVSKLFNGTWKVIKTGFKVIIIGFVLLFIVALFTVDDTGSTGSTDSVTVVEQYNIQNVKSSSSYGIITITGTLVADKDYEYLQIDIPTYDSNGNKTGSAFANVSNLAKGETWRFEAIGTSGTKYNIDKTEVSGW